MLIENHHVERLFPVCSLITADASYKIVSGFAAEAAGCAGKDVPEISGVGVVAINRGQLRGRIDVEVSGEVDDASKGRRRHAGAAKHKPATQPLARSAVIHRNASVGVRVEGTVRRGALCHIGPRNAGLIRWLCLIFAGATSAFRSNRSR